MTVVIGESYISDLNRLCKIVYGISEKVRLWP